MFSVLKSGGGVAVINVKKARNAAWLQQKSGKNVLVLSLNNSQTRAFYTKARQ